MNEKLYRSLQEAEHRAKQRDNEHSLNLGTLSQELQKASEQNLKIVQMKPRNPAGFVQVIADNLNHIIRNEYMSSAELGFLLSIMGLVEMHSNAIVNDEGQYMNVSTLAQHARYSVRQTRELISKLLEKGIIFEFVDVQQFKKHGRVVEERPLYMNPEIVFSGDRNRINSTLCRLVMNADSLERNGVHLPWKLWLEHGAEHGRLYKRSTWQKKRKDGGKHAHSQDGRRKVPRGR